MFWIRVVTPLFACLVIGCGQPEHTIEHRDVPIHEGGSLSHANDGPEHAETCRIVIDRLPPTYVLFNILQSKGDGRTCHKAGRTVLFIRSEIGSCPTFTNLHVAESGFQSKIDAEAEFVSCSAALNRSVEDEVHQVLIYSRTDGLSLHEFQQFGLDVQALVTNDGLPVIHFGASSGVVCMEADNVSLVEERIFEADIIDTDRLLASRQSGNCAKIVQEISGRPWPRKA